MTAHKVAILKNEDPFDHQPWIDACEQYTEQVDYKVIDITLNDWIENIIVYDPHICLLKPAGKTSLFRTLYQERVDVIVNDLGIKTYPTFDELKIYESKRFFAYWAKANQISHPKTAVFYSKKEAISFINSSKYPIVGKMNIGASGNGVEILHNSAKAVKYVERAFNEGLSSKTGPKLKKGKLLKRAWRKLTHPKELKNRLKTYAEIAADKQKGYVIFQEFIPHEFEWRAVRIGDSFFAHKKIKVGEKASGTLLKEYDNPPLALFDYVKKLTDTFNFRSVAVDIFESESGAYFVNEIQCIFGQSDPYQMLVNEKPGRYIFDNGQWNFEEGDFNQNQSYNLRLEYILSQLS